MDAKKIERICLLNNAILNFKDCYKGQELWGEVEGPLSAEKLISFLIENPHLQKIADEIKKLDV